MRRRHAKPFMRQGEQLVGVLDFPYGHIHSKEVPAMVKRPWRPPPAIRPLALRFRCALVTEVRLPRLSQDRKIDSSMTWASLPKENCRQPQGPFYRQHAKPRHFTRGLNLLHRVKKVTPISAHANSLLSDAL